MLFFAMQTRSGKIMRRILVSLLLFEAGAFEVRELTKRASEKQRKISAGEGDQLGDLSTLADPSVVDQIKEKFEAAPAPPTTGK